MKKIWILIIVLTLATAVFGCSKDSEKIVAVINGQQITQEEFDKRLNQGALMNGIDLKSEQAKAIKPMLEEMVINQLIDETLMLQTAKEKNIVIEDKTVDEKLKEVKENYKESFQEQLTQLNLTEKEYTILVKNQLTIEKLYEKVTEGISPNVDLLKYYEEHQAEYAIPEQVKARHILLATQADALDLIKQLEEGADFAELAKTKSIDPSAQSNEGDIGYFHRDTNLVPEFIEGAFALQVGGITKEPVMSQFGWHIIKVEDRIEAKQPSFEEVKEQLEEDLLLNAKQETFESFVENLKSKASVTNYIKDKNSQGEIKDNSNNK